MIHTCAECGNIVTGGKILCDDCSESVKMCSTCGETWQEVCKECYHKDKWKKKEGIDIKELSMRSEEYRNGFNSGIKWVLDRLKEVK